jgi:glyoxylase-like metal-dependent hydrolase (beta-lactamase superfamily II)
MPDLEIIAGEDAEAVTRTPGHGEGFELGSIAVKALHTPCHTQDSICWFMEDGDERVVFTGDTLFHGGVLSPARTRCSTGGRLTGYARLRQVLRGYRGGDAHGPE